MLTTIGTLDPPLGNARLQASKLIAAVLATNSDTINAELAKLGTVKVLWVCILVIQNNLKRRSENLSNILDLHINTRAITYTYFF